MNVLHIIRSGQLMLLDEGKISNFIDFYEWKITNSPSHSTNFKTFCIFFGIIIDRNPHQSSGKYTQTFENRKFKFKNSFYSCLCQLEGFVPLKQLFVQTVCEEEPKITALFLYYWSLARFQIFQKLLNFLFFQARCLSSPSNQCYFCLSPAVPDWVKLLENSFLNLDMVGELISCLSELEEAVRPVVEVASIAVLEGPPAPLCSAREASSACGVSHSFGRHL